jgi:hypothetical protein
MFSSAAASVGVLGLSSTTTPSRKLMMRPANRAMSCSWVTSTMVMPSRLSCCSSAMISTLVRAVERAGRLVGQHQLRIVDQRAGDGHALLLAAGKLRRMVVHALGQADLCEAFFCAGVALGKRGTAIQQGQGDIVQGGGARQQVEMLEHETELAVAHLRQFIAGELRDFLPLAGSGHGWGGRGSPAGS